MCDEFLRIGAEQLAARRPAACYLPPTQVQCQSQNPNIEGISPIEPGVPIAGRNPVATDAVATAVMGYDPPAERPDPPFVRGDNHRNLAYELGLGTNRLEDIEVVGHAIDDVRTEFEPYCG